MSRELLIALAGLAGYLLGAVPFAVIIARANGVDIFTVGSGNPGATNVKRSVGRRAGNLCFLLDFLKGLAAAIWPLLAFEGGFDAGIAGLAGAILGHSFSVFIGFRGGKGVAVTMGGLLALAPLSLGTGIGLWLATFYLSRYVSLASLVFGVSLPVTAWLLEGGIGPRFWLLLAVAVLIVVRHQGNIRRLLAGTESRFRSGRGTS